MGHSKYIDDKVINRVGGYGGLAFCGYAYVSWYVQKVTLRL